MRSCLFESLFCLCLCKAITWKLAQEFVMEYNSVFNAYILSLIFELSVDRQISLYREDIGFSTGFVPF